MPDEPEPHWQIAALGFAILLAFVLWLIWQWPPVVDLPQGLPR